MSHERGLVVSIPLNFSWGRMISIPLDLDPREVRFALLFWDKLEFPRIENLPIEGVQTAEFLAGAGILQRTSVEVPSDVEDAGEAFRWAHVDVYRRLDHEEPGVWSLATVEGSISFVDDELEAGRGALVQLHQAIPVPDKDVPLPNILEFREKRRSELLKLRHHLEDVYQKILSAGDGALAMNTEIERLDAAIADHMKTARETTWL